MTVAIQAACNLPGFIGTDISDKEEIDNGSQD